MNIIHWLTLILIAAIPSLAHADETDAKPENRLHYLPREQEIELALAAGPKHIRLEAVVFLESLDTKKYAMEKMASPVL